MKAWSSRCAQRRMDLKRLHLERQVEAVKEEWALQWAADAANVVALPGWLARQLNKRATSSSSGFSEEGD